MAVNAYVLPNVGPGETQAVTERMQPIPPAFAREGLGPHSIIVELQGSTQEDLTATLRSKIRSVPGVTGSVTGIWI